MGYRRTPLTAAGFPFLSVAQAISVLKLRFWGWKNSGTSGFIPFGIYALKAQACS